MSFGQMSSPGPPGWGSLLTTLLLRFVFVFFFFFLILSHTVTCQFIEIQTELGRVRGVRIQSLMNNAAIAFLGIPYALPPTGERRFKRPVSYPKWSPKTLVATNYKSCCPQLDMNGVPHGAEDCLYLNVFLPLHNFDQNQFSLGGKRFPVMVYFQGESFENGDAALYGAEKLLDWDVVLVTFNYRLGVLGWLSTGDEAAPGNWGLYDQLAVLRWVHDHIESFSGNPNSVTIFGQGAGASSAFLHLISPLSTGLFHRVIAQSGSPLCSWSMEADPETAAHEVATRTSCPTGLGNAELVRCLRKAPLGRLLATQQQGKIFGEFPHRMVPVIEVVGSAPGTAGVDQRLVPADPKVLISQGAYRRVPLMMGYNRDEAAFLYPLILGKHFIGDSSSVRTYLEEKLLPRFIRANLLDRSAFMGSMATNSVHLKGNRADIEREIANNILFKYFNFMNGRNYTDLATRFVNMSTDALYGACIDETLRLYSAATTASTSSQHHHHHHHRHYQHSQQQHYQQHPSPVTSALDDLPPVALGSQTNLLLPFANITYKYVFSHRGRNSMLSLILAGATHQQRHSFNRHFALPPAASSVSGEQHFGSALNSAVCHGDELFYLFALKFPSRRPDDNRDLLVQRTILSLWTDFAKHGFAPLSTGPDLPYWPPYTSPTLTTYLIGGTGVGTTDRYADSATHFWTRYLPSIVSNSAAASIVARPPLLPPSSDKLDHSGSVGGRIPSGQYYDRTSVSRLRTFAWSMLALSTVLLLLIFVLLGLLYYQRRRQTFSAESRQRARQTSARALARALATSAQRQSSSGATGGGGGGGGSTSGLY